MKRHWAYLKYVLRHKWFVACAGRKIGVSLWLILIHDLSKFLPSEWNSYANTFYKSDGSKQYNETEEFNRAWLMHQHRNPHHWQFWLLKKDNTGVLTIEMPLKYTLEMVADWMGAGRVITGKWECKEWYEKHKNFIILHPATRIYVETILEEC